MSQRSCNHLTGGDLCRACVHTSVRVGVPRFGPIWVHLCYAHRNASDDWLLILAKAKILRRDTPMPITPDDIEHGLIVQNLKTKSVCRINFITGHSVRVQQPNGSSPGMTKQQLIENYGLPATF